MFEPYSRETFEESQRWIAERGIFDDGLGEGGFDKAAMSLGRSLEPVG